MSASCNETNLDYFFRVIAITLGRRDAVMHLVIAVGGNLSEARADLGEFLVG